MSVVLPASGCEMIANVRRRAASADGMGMLSGYGDPLASSANR